MADRSSSLQKELTIGLTTGALTTVVIHPLDLVKVRLQLLATSSEPLGYKYVLSSILHSAQTNTGSYGGFIKEAYRGLGINLFGNAVAWGLYFGLYRSTKDVIYSYSSSHEMTKKSDLQRDSSLSPLMYLTAGASSGIITSILTNPIWVIKTRIMSTSSVERNSYKSAQDGLRRLLKEEGPVALWKGLMPSLFGVSQGAIYFMIYDTLKHKFSSLRHYDVNEKSEKSLKNSETFVISSVSKVISVSTVYPFQLLKSNLQSFAAVENNYTIKRLVQTIYVADGLKGFYKGISANLLRAIPSSCITFGIYENLRRWL